MAQIRQHFKICLKTFHIKFFFHIFFIFFLLFANYAILQLYTKLYFAITNFTKEFLQTVIRPILEYACPVWHSMLTKKLSSTIESQQIRAMRIIYGDLKYDEALAIAGISTLHDRREKLTRDFFHAIQQPSSCLHHLLPARRNSETVSRLRTAPDYPVPQCKTKRFQTSFLPFSLKKISIKKIILTFFTNFWNFQK